jgi:hypothetical protein
MADIENSAVLLEASYAVPTVSKPHSAASRRRRWFHLSVRQLLLLILLIGCGFGWVAKVIRTGQAQRRSVAAIYRAGGWVVYDTERAESQNPSSWKARWPKWLVDRLGVDYVDNVVFVNLHDRGNDGILACVAQLEQLKQLHRPGFAVTDAGLAHLAALNNLQLLSLEDTQVTDAGLAHLMALSRLKWLKLSRSKVTAAGVAELQQALPNLEIVR